jgi:DNA-binding response OmpR family regulator
MRVLVIDDDEVYRRLLRHHVATADEDATIDEYSPAESGRLPAEFTAAGFDVVILDGRPAGEDGLAWLADFRARPMFPPVIYVVHEPGEEAHAVAVERGAFGTIGKKKVDPKRLAVLLREGQRQRRVAVQAFRSSPAAARVYRFGSTVIKGERCVRPLATSALSTVYLAESEREGRLVCLKLLRQVPDNTDKSSTFDRFLQEYEIIGSLSHPNVVKIFDLGVADDHAYIAMEYFPDGDLRQRIKKGVTTEEAVRWLRQMAGALAAIHAVGVLHRDLKPGNVMLRRDGSIALIDFGLAKQLELDAEITATGEIFGTPYYMSPEQGHGREVDARSDVYSLGVIFWEMLTGKKPFLAPTPMAVIYKHSHAPIPELPEPLQERYGGLIAKLLAKDPDARFQTADELVEALDALPPVGPPP